MQSSTLPRSVLVAAMLFGTWSSLAHAESASTPTPKRPDWGLSTSIGYAAFQPNLGDSVFSGSGVPLGGTDRQAFRHSGRELGIDRPLMSNLDLRIAFLRPEYELGLSLFIGTHGGIDGSPSDPDAAAMIDRSAVSSIGGAAHLAALFPITDQLLLSIGPDIGVRGISVALRGFEQTTCHTKYSTYACDETATALQFFVQPRLSMTYSGVRSSKGLHPFLTGWIGGDLFPSLGMAGGVSLGVGIFPQ